MLPHSLDKPGKCYTPVRKNTSNKSYLAQVDFKSFLSWSRYFGAYIVIMLAYQEMGLRKSPFSPKRIWQRDFAWLQNSIWSIKKFWNNSLLTDETNMVKPICSLCTSAAIFGDNQSQHVTTNTSHQLSSILEEGWWFELMAYSQVQTTTTLRCCGKGLCINKYQTSLS